ncbi:histidine kinase [Streptomyces sp. DG2A-72]|uniref:sensor histidine kinase n=1 Tax=Streptomyces sp. DG2A-72 TaxID=3051386 RepID=UPI00265B895F|nr:histidine kinase [Streptomyces sp. DG2A-72]MDO0934381.1 histidine kinase [Streptomyces sp. DG2A-72]
MRGPERWWRGKSTPAKVETYTRWSYHSLPAVEIATAGLAVFGDAGLKLAGWLFVTVCAHALLGTVTVARALDWTRGRRPQPLRLLWALGVVTALIAAGALLLADISSGDSDADAAAGGLFATVVISGVGIIALGIRGRRSVLMLVAGFTAGAGLVALLLDAPAGAALGTSVAVLAGSGFLAFASVFSVWLLNAVYALDDARETRTRLAVAEERLRFGRDLHDVMGRNLAVIALKSELAVQLARRGRPEAVEQMIEVQRIAHETQREVRDVVRGYRESDLSVELAGAQGVLTAAGIDCEVSGSIEGLPVDVQSALGWVVREATTNVLRHGDAGRCEVSVRMREGRVALTVENDGARTASGSGGSGLAGLRERLAAVDGTLEAGRVREGVFRLVAEVPVTTAVVSGVAS